MTTKKQVDDFLSDPDYLELVELEREQRLLFITDMSETRVSAFLAWLFKPYEGHGLGERPVRELLLNAWRNAGEEQHVLRPRDLLRLSFSDLLVHCEYQLVASTGAGRGRSVDLLLISRQNKLVIAIENKFGSRVHSEQLREYKRAVQKKFPEYAHVFVYMDSNTDNDPDDSAWIKLDYSWLLSLIESQERSGLLSDQALHALRQVREYLNEYVASSSETGAKRDRLIEGLVIRHRAILDVFADFRAGDWREQVEGADLGLQEPLLIEMHQRWALWCDVLEQAHHAPLVAAARRAFGDTLEISATPAGAYFRLRDWQHLEREKDGLWGARVWAWSGRGGETYRVGSGIHFSNIRPDLEGTLRDISRQLRSPSMKAAPRDASWMRFSWSTGQVSDQAAEKVVTELRRLAHTLPRPNPSNA